MIDLILWLVGTIQQPTGSGGSGGGTGGSGSGGSGGGSGGGTHPQQPPLG